MSTLYFRFGIGVAMLFAAAMIVSTASAAMEDLRELKQEPVKIDFDDVVKSGEEASWNGKSATLRIAVASMISPKYTYRYYVELLNLIGDRIGRKVVFVQKKTYSEVNDMLRRSELDLAFVCSGPYVAGREDFGMELLAVPLCYGKTVYYSYFIASKQSGIQSFDDLRGKVFAFTDPLSNTGFMVPVYYLARHDETPERYFKKTIFTHSHDNSIQAVANGLADGAAVDSLIYEFMQAKNPELTAKTRVFDQSLPYGIPPVVVTPTLDPELKTGLKKIFLSIHEDPKGQALLKNIEVERFVEGHDSDYNSVRGMQEYLKSKQP